MKTTLPYHHRYQWQFVWREWRVAVYLSLVALFTALLVTTWFFYLLEQDDRLNAELSHSDLILDVHKLANFGAPGYVMTDWTEGTVNVQVRKIK